MLLSTKGWISKEQQQNTATQRALLYCGIKATLSYNKILSN